MKCRIKKVDRDSYFNKHIGLEMCPNHWTYKENAKVYNDGRKAQGEIKRYKLRDVEVEYEQ